jgi:hypothetical protein
LSMFTASILTLLSRNTQGGCLSVSKLFTCINIMHSSSSFYCMPHIFLFIYLHNVVSTKEFPFIRWGWDALKSYHFFSTTIICQRSSPSSRVLGFTSSK